MRRKTTVVLAAVLASVLAISLTVVFWHEGEYFFGKSSYQDAAQLAGLPQLQQIPYSESEEDPNLERLLLLDLSPLREINEDVAGWIVIPGTEVSYPLLHGEDNQYYLKHTWRREWNSVGSIFIDHRNSTGLSDFNTIVYGHFIRNKTMFGSLSNYREEAYWREHPGIYLVYGGNVYRYDIFAAYETDIKDHVYQLGFADPESREAYLSACLESSAVDTGITPDGSAQILTLSTCTNRDDSSRWVVQAVLAAEARPAG